MKNIYLLISLSAFLFFTGNSFAQGSLNLTTSQTSTYFRTGAGGSPNFGISGVSGVSGPLDVTVYKTDDSCYGELNGTAILTVHNGKRPFTYAWSPNVSADSVATGLGAGIYTVTVRDSGYLDSTNVGISIDQPSPLKLNSTIDYPLCTSNNGSIVNYPNGGISPYQYSWSNGSTTQSISGLPPGIYSLTLTDKYGCTVGVSDTLTVHNNITKLNKSVTNAYCGTLAGGTASIGVIVVSASTYSYNWSNSATTSSVSGLIAGTYSVTVVDTFGCSVSDTVNIYYPPFPAPPVCMVGVDSATGKNIVIWDKSDTLPVDSFIIYRETNVAGIYAEIGAQGYHVFSTFIDTGSVPAQQANRYKLACRDSCGGLSLLSNEHKTVHLTINQGQGNTWNLIWDAYEGFSFGTFNLYRGTSSNNMSLLTSIASNLYSYTDLSPPLGTVYYMIGVVNPDPCAPTARTTSNFNSSLSNIVSSSTVGIKPLIDESSVSIYPNPVHEAATVRLQLNGSIDLNVGIYDNTGRLIYEQTFTGVSNVFEAVIDCKHFAKGIYTIQFKTDGDQLNRKLVIE